MIIIDKEKYDKLKTLFNKHEFSEESLGDRIELALNQLAREFKGDVYDELGLTISTDQVAFHKGSVEPTTNTLSVHTHFKINRRNIVLLDNLEEVIEVPLNFTPPFVTRVAPPLTKVEIYSGIPATVPYDVIQYFPWGYDLERNVQIWKKKNV